MALGLDQSWHSSEKLQKILLEFHRNHASFPEAAVAEAQRHHTETMHTIRDNLQRNGVAIQFEYTGSAYEGIKVPSTAMEFDVMVILQGGGYVTAEETRPLYAQLLTTGRYDMLMQLSDPVCKPMVPVQRVLMPNKASSYFQSQLQRVINNYPSLRNTIKLRAHGPAVQMDVYTPGFGSLLYSVDMVPAFQVPSSRFGRYYVAKAFKEDDNVEGGQNTWRASYSLDEKAKITTIDRGNRCHKQCMRIIKVIRDREEGLRGLNSYILKTAVFSLDRSRTLDWSQTSLGRRFMDVLKFLAEALETGHLAHHYEPSFNLLAGMAPKQRENIMYRLKELLRSELHFYAALNRH